MVTDLLREAEIIAMRRLPEVLLSVDILRRTRTRPCRYWKWGPRPGYDGRVWHVRPYRLNNTPCRACTECASWGYTQHLGGDLWLSRM